MKSCVYNNSNIFFFCVIFLIYSMSNVDTSFIIYKKKLKNNMLSELFNLYLIIPKIKEGIYVLKSKKIIKYLSAKINKQLSMPDSSLSLLTDIGHSEYALQRVIPLSGLSWQHHTIGSIQYGVCYIRCLSAGGSGLLHHWF